MQELPNKHLLAQHQARLIHSQWTGEVAIRVEGGELRGVRRVHGKFGNLNSWKRILRSWSLHSHIWARGDPRVTDCCEPRTQIFTNDSKTTMPPCSHAKETVVSPHNNRKAYSINLFRVSFTFSVGNQYI